MMAAHHVPSARRGSPGRRAASRPSRRWWVGFVLLLVAGPFVVLWLLTPERRAAPLERFLPDRLGAAVRLGDLEAAWRRHWSGRPLTTPDAALKDLLVVTGEWDKLVKKRGEVGAQAWLRLVPKVLFETIGRESWLFCGEWGGARPGEGEAGLVLILPGGGSLRGSIGPLADLFLDQYRVSTSEVGGVTVYEYRSETERRSLTFCNVGGRIVASLRQHGAGPLPAIIARVRDEAWRPPGEADAARLAEAGRANGGHEAIFALLRPEPLLAQVREIYHQRDKQVSDDAERSMARWSRRLAGFERLTLRQQGDALLDLDLVGELGAGEANRGVEAESNRTTTTTTTTAAKKGGSDGGLTEGSAAPGGEVEIRAGTLADLIARGVFDSASTKPADLGGLTMELLAPGLAAQFAADPAGPPERRIGAAVYPSATPIMARVLSWTDQPPLEPIGGDPAAFWSAVADGAPDAGAGDRAGWAGPAPFPTSNAAEAARWAAFAREQWAGGNRQPEAFAGVDFSVLADASGRIPAFLLGKKPRKKLAEWQDTLRGLALSLGGATLRLDQTPDQWTLRLRTMRAGATAN